MQLPHISHRLIDFVEIAGCPVVQIAPHGQKHPREVPTIKQCPSAERGGRTF
jgi:hypothetical protein